MLPSINALDARPETTGSTGTTDARADVANLPGGAFFEGRWQTAELTSEVRDPEDGLLLGRACISTAADVRRAIAHIHRHLQRAEWPLRARRQALERAGGLLTEQLSAGTKALRIGPKLDRGTDVGPLISEAEARRFG